MFTTRRSDGNIKTLVVEASRLTEALECMDYSSEFFVVVQILDLNFFYLIL